MRNKIALIAFIVIISTLSTSCVPSNQIDQLGIVVTMALDIEGEEVLVTSQIMAPMSNGSHGQLDMSGDIMFVQSRGKTVLDALKNATLTYDRKLFLSHNSIIIFGEELAKRGVGDLINFFAYDIGVRETAYLLVAKGFKAYEILGVPSISDEYLLRLIENSYVTAKTRSMTFTEYLRYYFERETPVLGVVEIIEKREIEDAQREKTPTRKVLDVTGGAPFFKDRLQGYYSGEEMIGFNFIVDEIKDNLIVFETPEELTEESIFYSKEGRFSTIQIIKSRTRLDAEIKDDRIHFNINVYMKGSLSEETKGLNVPDDNVRLGIEKACSKQIENYINKVMDKAQKDLKLDTFGFDRTLHRKHPKIWSEVSDNWQEIFSECTYTVNVNTTIERTGEIDLPTNIRKGRE